MRFTGLAISYYLFPAEPRGHARPNSGGVSEDAQYAGSALLGGRDGRENAGMGQSGRELGRDQGVTPDEGVRPTPRH